MKSVTYGSGTMNIKEVLQKSEYFRGQNLDYAFDSLTGVLNRESICTYIKYLIENNIPFSVCLSDIDNFKYVNDNYGHMVGDELLAAFAKKLVSSVGDKCIVGRYGGDEFVLVSERTIEYKDIWNICHKINKDMSKMYLQKYQELSITVTTGVSRFPIDGQDFETLVCTADKALYRGKMKGRNCFIIYLAEKHASIVHSVEKEAVYNSMDLHARIFKIMSSNLNLVENVNRLLGFLSTTLMLDHISLEDESGIVASAIHPLSIVKQFQPIGVKILEEAANGIGLLFVNQKKTLLQTNNNELYDKCDKQKIRSIFSCSVEAYSNKYGVLIVESTSKERIWQAKDMDLFVTAAKLLGVVLYYQGKTLQDLKR